MISSLLTFLLVGLVALIVAGVALSIIGAALGLAGFLLFKVAPIVLIGYVVVRLLKPRHKKISEADRRWLES